MKKLITIFVTVALVIALAVPTLAAPTTAQKKVVYDVVKIYNNSATSETPCFAIYDSTRDAICIYYYGKTGQAISYASRYYSTSSSTYQKMLAAMTKSAENADASRQILRKSGNYSTDVWVFYSTTAHTKNITENAILKNAFIAYLSSIQDWQTIK